MAHDDECTRENARTTEAGHCSSDNQGFRVWSDPADQTSGFKQGDCTQEAVLDGKVRVDLAIDELERAHL